MRWYAALLQSGPMSELSLIDRPRILIVEDDLDLQSEIVRLVRQISPIIQMDWLTAADDLNADIRNHRLILSYAYDLVISDLNLPGKSNGLDLWEACQVRSPETPFLLMSGIGNEAFKKRVEGAQNAPLFLPKPFSVADIRGHIQKLLADELPTGGIGAITPLKKSA